MQPRLLNECAVNRNIFLVAIQRDTENNVKLMLSDFPSVGIFQ